MDIKERIGRVLWQFGNKARNDLYQGTHETESEPIDLNKEHKKMVNKIIRLIKSKN